MLAKRAADRADFAASLAEQGHLNERGKPFNPKSVAVMLAGRAQ